MRKISLAVVLAMAATSSLLAAAQERAGGATAGAGTSSRPGDCPPAPPTRGMVASAAPATVGGGGTTSTSTKKSGFANPRGWSPVGTPGMFTGIDTGVTRGPVGSTNGTTGTYGVGSESSPITSIPAADQGAGTPSSSSAAPSRVDKGPC